MQIALNKLVRRKVKNLEVVVTIIIGKVIIVHVLVEQVLTYFLTDHKATVYKMDLKYDGHYRMMQTSSFNIARDFNDVLLMPVILESMKQVYLAVNGSIERLYNAINGDEEDVVSFIRKQCDSPVLVSRS